MFYGRLVGHLLRWALIPSVLAGSSKRHVDDTLMVPEYVTKYGMSFLFGASLI